MSNKVCPKCKVDFKYISLLKRHLENSVRCSANETYINNTINNINTNSNVEHLFICSDCNKHFKFKTSIYRHKSISKCAKNKANLINQSSSSLPTSSTPPITQSQTNINTNSINIYTNEKRIAMLDKLLQKECSKETAKLINELIKHK